MKSFKQLREELGSDFVSKPNKPYKDVSDVSNQDKPRRPYRNVGGVKIKYYDYDNDGTIDAKRSIPAHKIMFNIKQKNKKETIWNHLDS